MTASIDAALFSASLRLLLDETFDNVRGIYLDRGTSMFETLATIPAERASVPVGGRCATLAAQVKHVAFYLDVMVESLRSESFTSQDWDKIWRETSAVSPEEWEEIKASLRASYDRVLAFLDEQPAWTSENAIGGAMAFIVHSAYHLGEIRQALCTLQDGARGE